jgi:hypothetical protein
MACPFDASVFMIIPFIFHSAEVERECPSRQLFIFIHAFVLEMLYQFNHLIYIVNVSSPAV